MGNNRMLKLSILKEYDVAKDGQINVFKIPDLVYYIIVHIILNLKKIPNL